jgi:hypothetical protein
MTVWGLNLTLTRSVVPRTLARDADAEGRKAVLELQKPESS